MANVLGGKGAKRNMKVILLFLTILIVLFSVSASATGMSIRGGTAQDGYYDDLTCDEDGVSIIEWNIDPVTRLVHSVIIGCIDGYQTGDLDLHVVLKQGGTHLALG